MKSSSDQVPAITEKSNGKTQIRFNITPFTRTTMDKEQSGYNYDYVEITGELDRAKIIDAIIRDKCSISEEFALINNKLKNKDEVDSEYNEYQELRVKAKGIALTVLAQRHEG